MGAGDSVSSQTQQRLLPSSRGAVLWGSMKSSGGWEGDIQEWEGVAKRTQEDESRAKLTDASLAPNSTAA